MKCRVCKCTEERACANGCGWAPGEDDLCTNCAAIVEAMLAYREVAYRFSLSSLMREVDRPALAASGCYPARMKRRATGGAS